MTAPKSKDLGEDRRSDLYLVVNEYLTAVISGNEEEMNKTGLAWRRLAEIPVEK